MVDSLEEVHLPFVVSYHSLPDHAAKRSHWDLMFALRSGDPEERCLETWSTESDPITELFVAKGRIEWLEKLPDHRSLYLNYEGDISHNRGRIRPLLRGHIRQRSLQTDRREFYLHFDCGMQGKLTLTLQEQADHWKARWMC